MRLTQGDLRQIKRREKMWKRIGAKAPSKHFFKNNHSFNCGCSMCYKLMLLNIEKYRFFIVKII